MDNTNTFVHNRSLQWFGVTDWTKERVLVRKNCYNYSQRFSFPNLEFYTMKT